MSPVPRLRIGHVAYLLVRTVVLMAVAAAVVWALRVWAPGLLGFLAGRSA